MDPPWPPAIPTENWSRGSSASRGESDATRRAPVDRSPDGDGRRRGGRPLNSQRPAGGETFDVIVVGSGIAGLTAALTAATRARVALVTAGLVEDGATRWAQGGIAAAIATDDSPDLHLEDTVAAGRGLCDERAVRVLVDEGPARVHDLADWGIAFDLAASDPGRLSLGREAAHSRDRIVHADGDATGREVERGLAQRLAQSAVTVFENTRAVRLLRDGGGRCCAVEVCDVRDGGRRLLGAGAVILATGGAGRLWRNTTNPPSATGQGVALAWDAGAEVESMEFMQFHPTALAVAGAPRFLISEAMRGEGAHVVDARGERFLFDSDPSGELAGRDVVSRAVWERLARDGTDHVFLDCRPLGDTVRDRFPTVTAVCRDHGIDITTQPVPIAPAAHYMIGGVRTDLDGASSVAGLYACGEVASTGVHGANRLASNSLLEGAVFGRRAALGALEDVAERPAGHAVDVVPSSTAGNAEVTGLAAAAERLGDAMWEGCGLLRERSGLERALQTAGAVAEDTAASLTPAGVVLHQSAIIAAIICRSALLREETRGAHVRTDFPSTREAWHGVVVMQKERGHRFDRNA